MISFRFHLVSLIAVFLALALGIGMGATVIDKATVDSLKRRVASVEQQRDASNQQVNDLNRRLTRGSAWDAEAQQLLISGALTEVPVTFVAVRGSDESALSDQRKLMQSAGAAMQGTLWFPQKASLSDAASLSTLQTLLGTASVDANQLRQALIARVAAVIAGASPPSSLKELQRAAFIDWDGGLANDIANADFAGSRIVFMSGTQAVVPNEQLATPLAKLLAAQPTRRVVAIEAGRDPDSRTNTSGQRAVWLDTIREDSSIDGRLSTVDYVETDLGRTAAVIATRQLPSGKTGDYGVSENADSAMPKPG